MSNVFRLVVEYKRLAFPHGGHNIDVEPAKYDDFDTPSLLFRLYEAGDRDSIPWPLSRSAAKRAKQLKNLAHALFDERECNAFFPADAVIELPDGSVFDFCTFHAPEKSEGHRSPSTRRSEPR